jgi:hypothetical protein
MNSKSILKASSLIVSVGVILACGFGSAPSPTVSPTGTAVPPTDTSAPPPTGTALPASTNTSAPQVITAAYNGVSFTIPGGLAAGAAADTIPAIDDQSGPPWEVAPAATQFTLQDFQLQGGFLEPRVMVYPAQEYAAINAGAQISVERLQAVLDNPATPLEGENLPQVPGFNAQMVAFQAGRLDFQNGAGVRVLAEYSQAVMPISNHGVFYQFIGLTSDGKYLVIALFPVQVSFLADTDNPDAPVPADGVPFPDINNAQTADFEAYYQAMADKMNSSDASSFTPRLAILDELIRSMAVTP